MSTIDTTAPVAGLDHFNYERGSAMRRYMLVYALAVLSVAAVWGGMGGVLIPLHVQQIEFGKFFAGAMASVNLQELVALKAQIAAGAAKATAEQARLLEVLAAYESAKASSLATIKSVAVAFTMVLQPLIGIASDRTRSSQGRRAPWLLIGAITAVAGLAAMQYSGAVWQVLAGWVVAQVGLTMVLGPLNATVVDRVPASQRGMLSAITGVGLLVGFVAGTTVAGALFGQFRAGSYLLFAAAVLVFSIAFVVVARDRSSLSMQQEPASLGTHLLSCTYALRDTDFRWVWISRVLVLFAYACAATYTVYMLQSYIEPALDAGQAAKTLSLLSIAALPATLLAMVVTGRWSDRIMRRTPFVIGASLLLGASMCVPFAWPTLAALYIQFVVGGLAFGTFLAVDQALLIDVLPNKGAAARDLGMGQFAANLGSLMGPILAGVVQTSTGGYRMIWLASVLLAVLAAFALMRVKRAR